MPFVENVVALASVLTILAISFERYYAVCHPLKVQYTCTFRRMLKIVLAIWLTSIISCLPFFYIAIFKDSSFVDGTPIKVCRMYVKSLWRKIYIVWMSGICFFVPLCVLIGLYIIIGRKLMAETFEIKMRTNSSAVANIRARHQVIYMLSAIVCIFFTCLMPIRLVGAWTIFVTKLDIKDLGLEGYLNLLYFARVMFYMNSVLNPICYIMISTKFRECFNRALTVCRSTEHVQLRSTSSVPNHWTNNSRTTYHHLCSFAPTGNGDHELFQTEQVSLSDTYERTLQNNSHPKHVKFQQNSDAVESCALSEPSVIDSLG